MKRKDSPVAAVDGGRRDVLKMAATAAIGAAASAYIITTRKSEAQTVPDLPSSPPVTPWVEPMPVQTPKAAVPESALSPTPGANPGAGEAGRLPHQAYTRFPPQKYYEISVHEAEHSFHPDLLPGTIWGYDGTFPGALIHARYGEPVCIRFRNDLPQFATGFGAPEITTHLHNLHSPSESDGFPTDYFSATAFGPSLTRAGQFKDNHYPMCYAGCDQYGGYGDAREALGTMWYHDHRVDFTAPNVYRGLCGFYLAYDEYDSGDENDKNRSAFRLPSGEYDVPIMLTNVHFDGNRQLYFDEFNPDGFLGDLTTVNGKVLPYFNVARRKYRFRFLNSAVARVYDLQIRYNNYVYPLKFIANDGNLLPGPLNVSNVRFGPAERVDLVVDFSGLPMGAELYLVNRALHEDGRRAEDDKFLNPPVPILKFVVNRNASDNSQVPSRLRQLPPINLNEVVNERDFLFDRNGATWTINGQLFDGGPQVNVSKGTAEIWTLRNIDNSWHHPVHIHFEEFRILSRNGKAPPMHERGRKDVVMVSDEAVRVFIRFRDFTGKYVMHCHNLTHEDHAMMLRWDIV